MKKRQEKKSYVQRASDRPNIPKTYDVKMVSMQPESGIIDGIKFLDSNRFITYLNKREICLWSLSEMKIIGKLKIQTSISNIVINSQLALLLICSKEGYVKILSLKTLRQVAMFYIDSLLAASFSYITTSNHDIKTPIMIAYQEGGSAFVYNVFQRKLLSKLIPDLNLTAGMMLGKYDCLFGSSQGSFIYWDTKTNTKEVKPEFKRQYINDMVFIEKPHTIAVSGYVLNQKTLINRMKPTNVAASEILIINIKKWECLNTIPIECVINQLMFIDHLRKIGCFDAQGRLRVIDQDKTKNHQEEIIMIKNQRNDVEELLVSGGIDYHQKGQFFLGVVYYVNDIPLRDSSSITMVEIKDLNA